MSALLPLPLAPLPLAPLPLGLPLPLPLPLPLLTGLEVELVSLSNLSAIWRKPGRLTGLELPLLIYRHQSYHFQFQHTVRIVKKRINPDRYKY